jgi:cytochrome b6-f complex iron-sulfur subunit
MQKVSVWPVVLGLALAMALVVVIVPTRYSLAYAGSIVVLIGLIGWVLEARSVAGPAPAVEPEHEEEEEAPGPSYWPVVVALGVVAIAAGIVYDWGYGALLVALPLAAAAAAAWVTALKTEIEAAEAAAAEPRPIAATGGAYLMPVPQRELAAQAAAGAAIAIERTEEREISRRGLLRLSFWMSLGAGLAASVGVLFDFMWPRGITGFGGTVIAGTVDQFPPGSKTEIREGRLWLVNLTEQQGGPGFLALWWKCPHLGCTVPWLPNFNFVDPTTGQEARGWFRCPCHGSTYTHAGVRVFGPAPRSMDRMALTIDASTGRISIDTGTITNGTPDNYRFAVRAP